MPVKRWLPCTADSMCLSPDSELSTTKRQLSRALHEVEELKHTHERHALEAASSQSELQARLKEYATRMENLERQRASLFGKCREAEERDQSRRDEVDKMRTEMQTQVRTLRQQLATVKDQHAELGASYRDLEHSSKQDAAAAASQAARVSAVEQELELARQEIERKATELNEERERRRTAETELERASTNQADAANAEVVKEELHRALPTVFGSRSRVSPY